MRYQDYVIKDGKFVGEFERMYQECDNPWHQMEEANISYSRADTVNSIHRFKLRNVLEAGCGLGYFTAYLAEHCHNVCITGMDISDTAIKKAKSNFPQLTFAQGDLSDLDGQMLERYDGIIFSEIMWYILDNLDSILKKLKMSAGGGHSLSIRHFIKVDNNMGENSSLAKMR